jgi:hypothetical protein
VSIERRPYFVYQFAKVFNGKTFLAFLKELVRRCPRRKAFLIIDNGPCHQLDAVGQRWLAEAWTMKTEHVVTTHTRSLRRPEAAANARAQNMRSGAGADSGHHPACSLLVLRALDSSGYRLPPTLSAARSVLVRRG